MALPINAIVILILLGILGGIIFFTLRNAGASGLKLMLLGIHFSIIGGIIAVDPNSNLGGVEYLLVFAGFIISATGFRKND